MIYDKTHRLKNILLATGLERERRTEDEQILPFITELSQNAILCVIPTFSTYYWYVVTMFCKSRK